jgi:hypothetical protein
VRDYLRHVGGNPEAYAGVLPPHLFPQWSFPLAAKTLAKLPYPLTRVVNAGCRIEQRAALPANEALVVRARLEMVEDDGRRAKITQTVVTGTRQVPEAVVAEMRAYVPLAKGGGGRGDKAAPVVPSDAEEIARFEVGARAGLDFAVLTGDFNPIHWVPPAAKAAGFKGCILHGFATLARAYEALVSARCAGVPAKMKMVDVRFVRPLVLPGRVVACVREDGVWLGEKAGGEAYLEGRFEVAAAS